MSSLLQTKVQLPPSRLSHIQRERIQQQIDNRPDTHLVLISAPAGFGKSSCLVEWAHHLKDHHVQVAWYALDEHDNDPARFAAYLLQSCLAADRALLAHADSSLQSDLHEAVNQLLNAASDYAQPLVLILDDYHLIKTPQIHDAVGRMCDRMPPNMRLAIGTRADPPLQLARLRARGEMAELRLGDLRFTKPEIAAWLHTKLGWNPSPDFLTRLDAMTEGWAAALTLIMTSTPDGDEEALARQIARYSQSQRHIFDYFAQEILDQQPDDIRQFLLNTCVLDQLEPEPCRALTGNPHAPLLLEQLARQNLFIIPLSDDAPVFRYHHLFAQFLRQHLALQDRRQYRKQHHHAATWYAENGQIVEAVHHALAAEDYDYAAVLITDRAWETLTARGEIMTVIHWLARFPAEELQQHPRLCLYFSRALYLVGDAAQSQRYVQIATDTLAADADKRHSLQAIAYGYQATLAAYRGDVLAGRHWIERANTLREHVEGVDRVRIANTDAFLCYLTGSLPSARAAYEHALSMAEQIGHDFLALDAHSYLAQIDLLGGELQAVQDRCEMLLAQYLTRIAPLSAIMLPLARVQYQRNHVVAAEATLRDAIKLAHRANLTDILWFAYINLAEVLSLTDIDEATAIVTRAQQIADQFHSPIMASIIKAAQAQLLLRSVRMDEAADWAANFQQDQLYHQQYEAAVAGRIQLAQGRYKAAKDLFMGLIAESEENGRTWYVITGRMLQALAHRASGEVDQALTALEHALIVARPHGFVRLFLDEGQPMLALLREAVKRNVVTDYAAYLLDIAAQADTVQHPADVLTDREIEVLEHIAAGDSNNDIADALVLSIGTVKSHIHHIMTKLDAQNRTEAVSKARSLNILSD